MITYLAVATLLRLILQIARKIRKLSVTEKYLETHLGKDWRYLGSLAWM